MNTNLRIALKSLRQSPMQALLTLLGMSVGVAMVVVVSGLGLGAQQRIEDQIESAGPTRIILRPGNFRPAAMEMSGQQDSGGGEPGEGSVAMNLLEPDVVSAKQATGAKNIAVADARRRAIAAAEEKVHRTPATLLNNAHVALLSTSIEGVRAVAATVRGNVSVDPTSGIVLRSLRIEGIGPALPEMRSWTLAAGRLPDAGEYSTGATVMVTTGDVVRRLWPGEAEPIGRSLTLKGRTVRLVGIIAAKDADQSSVAVPLVYVPLALAGALLARTDYDSIAVRTASVGVTTAVASAMRDQLRTFHKLPTNTLDDFRIETQSVSAMPGMGSDPRLMRAVHSNVVEFEQASWEEMAKSLRQANRTFTVLLAAAAGVSLVVGGIGVMNIMLVSVTARTREIGLRMAVGAREGDVMVQFLVEAVVLAAMGGAIGLLLGTLGLGVARYGLHWATAVSPTMLLLALMMAAGTGGAFGYGPARRAALLDPVVAVRSE